MGDVQLEEVVPPVEGLRVQRVDVGAVGEGEPLLLGAGEVPHQRRAVPAGLLVLPLAGQEHRHLDLVDERDRVERVGGLRDVVLVGLDLRQQVDRLAVQRLVRQAGLVAVLDPLPGPRLTTGRAGRQRVVHPLLRPREREAGVEDAAREERGRHRVDRRQRRDRGQVRRVQLRGEQLADRAVGDAHHADPVPLDPRLAGDRLDHVVRVEVLQRLEEVVGPARAAGAAHAHVDDGEAHQVGQGGDAVLRPLRGGGAVAGVLDQRRVRRQVVHAEVGQLDARGQAGQIGRAGRRVHRDRQLGAVPGGEVAVAVAGDRLVVDRRVPLVGVLGSAPSPARRRHRRRRGAPGSRRPAPGRGTARHPRRPPPRWRPRCRRCRAVSSTRATPARSPRPVGRCRARPPRRQHRQHRHRAPRESRRGRADRRGRP